MATKQFLDLNGLSQYHDLITEYIGTEDAKSIKSISVSGNTVSFFKTADGSGTAAYTVNLPDVSGFMDKIANASGDKILVSNSSGEAVESDYVIGAISRTGIVTGYLQGESGRIIVQGGSLGDIYSSELDIDDIATTTDLADKIDKISNATGGKIATTTATGEVAESNTSISDLTTAIGGKVAKITNATGGKIATTTASGEVAESGTAIADLAQIGASGFTTGYIVTADSNGKLQATTDPGHFINYIAGATGGKIVTSTNAGQVAESNTAISDLATQTDLADKIDKPESFQGDYFLMSHDDGEGNFEIVEGFQLAAAQSEGLLTGYFDNPQPNEILTFNQFGTTGGIVNSSGVNVNDIMTKIDSASGDKVLVSDFNGEAVESDIDVSNLITGSLTTGYYLVLSSDNHEVTTDGSVTISDIATLDYIGTIPQGSSATDVIGYIDEVAGDVGDEMEVTLVEAQTPTTGYLKTYELYQGGNAAANLVGKIDIPKDLVVTSGEIVVNPTGQPAGTYLKLTIANQTAPVYINVADLCDVYTAASGAAQVQLAISATNEISATLVAGGVGTTELAANAVTTAKIADDAVTADKVAISAHTEAQTAGAGNGGLNLSITTTDGQVSAVSGSIAANTYDAYGAASTVQSTVIGTAGDAASANTINGAKAYADAATAAIATADIQALFA